MTKSSLLILLILCVSIKGFSQEEKTRNELPPKPLTRVYTTQFVTNEAAPKIDGSYDDAAWDLVGWTSNYVQNEPNNGAAPIEQTKFKVVYDSKNIYFVFLNLDKDPDNIERRLSRRDGFEGDWIELNIDSYHDKRTAFSFTVTAAGVKGDEFISNNGNNWDSSWNPIWYAKTQITEEGWVAEFRIPLTQLRFSNEQDQVWGIQSTRRYFRTEERSLWQHVLPNSPGWVSEFGELRGLKGIKPQKQLEIQPYGVAQLDTYEKEDGNPFRDGTDTKFAAGLDAKIGITNDLTVDLTVNPDFGQVEADPGAIALDGFEIFFQEQRPFFVENKNIFDFNIGGGEDNLFFSRRIGRNPQGYSTADIEKGEYEEIPDFTTILGAAKFSGKTKNGWSIGVLESVTAKEYAKIELSTNQEYLDELEATGEKGEEREEIVEPLTNFMVARLQKDFNDNNSYIGGVFTSTNRNIEGNLDFLHKSAYSGGLDFKHNWNDRKFYIKGNFEISNVNGSKEAILNTQTSLTHLFQREDATHIRVDSTLTSLTGTGGKFQFGKQGGGNWRYYMGGHWKSPKLELNDIGFLRQADVITQYTGVTRVFTKPTSWYRRAELGAEQFSTYDFEGNYNRMQIELKGEINYKNNWWSDGGVAYKPRIYSNTVLRGGPRWRWSDEHFFYFFSGTNRSKKFSATLGYIYSQARQNNFGLRKYEARFNYQPLNALSLSLSTEYSSNPNKTQYATQQNYIGDSRYILSKIDQETLSATLRINYTFNPNLTLQYYGQPFIARGKYSEFNYVNNPVAEDLNERVTWYNENQISFVDGEYNVDENEDGTTDYSFGDPNFAYVQFRSNLVLRWEYIPGSEVFFVWSQGVTGFGDALNDFNTILDNQLLSQSPQNTFLIKATYRFML
tara:strand:- start:6953 stop:9646 length:2694 start_codon:yes stop_codon:yes gene_type:complete